MGIREPKALPRELVDVRRGYLSPVNGQIAIPHIVGVYDDDIGFFLLRNGHLMHVQIKGRQGEKAYPGDTDTET
jgi:hypothetical protein